MTGKHPLRVLFVMRRLSYLIFVKSTLELIVDRGHELTLLLEEAPEAEAERAWLEQMESRPNFRCIVEDQFANDPARGPAIHIRRAHEHLRLKEARYADRSFHQKRKSAEQSPDWILDMDRRGLLRTRAARQLLLSVVAPLDRAMPLPSRPARFVRETAPDVVVVLDHGRPGSLHSAYVQAAREEAIPVALWVASWDNLTTRQRTRTLPNQLFVWNEWQVREAIDLHGFPPETVVTVGAPSFDDWFTREPRDPRAFKERVGLDPERPYILWTGGALHPAERTEAQFARDWLSELRSLTDPLARTIGVMLRPHPLRLREWLATDYSDFANVVVYPGREMASPLDPDRRADYFDSMYHASVVVGVNSSAMIESAIIGRSVLSILEPEFHHSQEGTFHFSYLLEENGGPVRTAQSLDEHFDQLRQALQGGDEASRPQTQAFVERFVRPRGLDRPSTPIAVDQIEDLADRAVTAYRDTAWVRLLRQTVRAWLRVGQIPAAVRLRTAQVRGRSTA